MDQLKKFCLMLLGRKQSGEPTRKSISHPLPLSVRTREAGRGSAPVIPPPTPPKPPMQNSRRSGKPSRSSRSGHTSSTASRHRYTRYYASHDNAGHQGRRQRHAENEARTAFSGLGLSQGCSPSPYPHDSTPSGVNLSTSNGRLQNTVAIKQQLLSGVKFHDVPAAQQVSYVHQSHDLHEGFVTPEIVHGGNDIYPRGFVPGPNEPAYPSFQPATAPKTRRYSPKNLSLYPIHIARSMVTKPPQNPPQPVYAYETPTIVKLARGPQSRGLRINIYGPDEPIPDPGIFINNGKNGSHWKAYNPHPDHYAIDKKTGRRCFR